MVHHGRLTRFPTERTPLNCSVIGQCSMAMNRVFRTMQIVMARSTNGSITIKFTICLTFSHGVQQSQIKQVLANLYQHGGHFCLDSSSSREKKVNNVLTYFSQNFSHRISVGITWMFPLGLCYFQVIFDDCIDVAVKANAQSKKKKKKALQQLK